MKAFVIEENNGEEYGDYDRWIEAIYLVPNDFNPKVEYTKICLKAIRNKLCRFRKNYKGVYLSDKQKLKDLWFYYLNNNFKKLEIIERDYE